MQVACPSRELASMMRWDSLILRCAKEGFMVHNGVWQAPLPYVTHRIESQARHAVANEIADASAGYPLSTRAQIPIADVWGAIISLNFDTAWLNESQFKCDSVKSSRHLDLNISRIEEYRLFNSLIVTSDTAEISRRVWFPNGSLFMPKSIRMGLHNYGSAPHAIQQAFKSLKSWEHKTSIGEKAASIQLTMCSTALMKASDRVVDLSEYLDAPPLPLSWVAELLYRPLFFAGEGLSEQGAGLWWLLAQRARNTARTGAPANVYVLVDAQDRPSFWRTQPFGVKAISCNNWDQGWEAMLEIIHRNA